MKKIISVLCAAALLPTFSVSAEEEKTQIGPVNRVTYNEKYSLKTPEENIFRIEGSDKEFVLLDDEDGFFVLAKDQYGKRAFDPDGTQKFDIEDSNNIAYWLNNGFLKDGNGGLKLPDEIIKYIDPDREWFTEGGFSKGNCPEDYTTTCGVTLLSQIEWSKYDEVFGVVDDIGLYGWWLRTGRGIGGNESSVMVGMTGQGRIGETFGQTSSNSTQYYVRPAFYLKDEFFTTVKLDKMGNNVGMALARHFSREDFQGEGTLNYNDRLLRNAGFDIPFEVDDGDRKISENILNGEYFFELSNKSTKDNIVMGQRQFIKTVFPVNETKCYEIVLKAGLNNVSENNGVILYADYYAADGKTKVGMRKELLTLGGTRRTEEYIINHTSVPDGAEFMLFTLEFKEGVSGSVSFEGLSMKVIRPEAEFTTDWEPLNIINPKEDSFEVRITCDTTLPKTFTAGYTIEYDADGYVFHGEEQKLRLSTEGVGEYTIPMKNVRRGNGTIELYVKFGDCVVTSRRLAVTVLETYDWSRDNGITRHGIVVHPDQYWGSNKTIANAVYDAGFNLDRSDMSWYFIEINKIGNYDWTKMDSAVTEMGARNMKWIPILCYSNSLYTPGNNKTGIASNETLEGFLTYVREVVKRYPQFDTYEIWNEPNGNGFWAPKANVNDYANFVKIVSKTIKEIRPDATVVAGAIDVSKNGPGYSRELFDLGIYPYIDAFSVHPYYHTKTNDENFLKVLNNYIDIVEENGGWKELYLTEIGWTTYGNRALEEIQAGEMVKILTHSDYLGVLSTIFNITAGAEDFGMIDTDTGYRVKPNYVSTTTYFVQTTGAQFITKLDINPDCHTFLYRKNGEPMLVSWCNTGGEAVLEFENDVKVYDMYGNLEYVGKTVEQNANPQYIYLSDGKFMKDNLKTKIVSLFDEFKNEYKTVLSDEVIGEIDKNNAYILNADEFTAEDVDRIYLTGAKIIDYLGNDIIKSENTTMMHKYHKAAMETADFMSLSGKEYENLSEGKLNAAEDEYKSTLSDDTDTKRFTYELLRHAKKYSKLANQTANTKPVEKGLANAYDVIAENLVKWAEIVMKIEEIEFTGINFQAVPGVVESYEGVPAKLSLYVYNCNDESKKGVLRVKNSNGEVLSETKEITLPANGKYIAELVVNMDDMKFGEDEFTISFEGETLYETKIKAKIKPRVEVVLENSEKTVDNITSVALDITNKMTEKMSGTVKITPPEGWTAAENLTFEAKPEETVKVDIPVTKTERAAFNCYMFKAEVYDGSGRLLSEKTLPLDFSVIVKADNEISAEEFDGDISDWSNAYPSYINMPDNPDSKEAWKESDVAARVFAKWDDNYFYLLADVYDNIQNQLQHESAIFNGDSLQLAFDTLNTKSESSYDKDDYEYGFALTLTGEESYAWQAAAGKETGVKPSEWSRILRDEENKNTRYLIKIPKQDLEPMDFSEGSVIGFNLLVNDANLIGNRENWCEITWGIGTRKDPSSYRNWTLSAYEEITDNRLDEISAIFGVKMGDVSAFSDISGHWAADYIKSAYSKGLMKGMGNNIFSPDTALTKAQAIALAERLLDLDTAECTLSDVQKEEWYYEPIAKMQSAGLIPDELIKDNKLNPTSVITREEFAAVIAGILKNADSTEYNFNDKDNISDWAKKYVYNAANSQIMIGDEENNFNPKGGLTRAEAAVIILKLNEG